MYALQCTSSHFLLVCRIFETGRSTTISCTIPCKIFPADVLPMKFPVRRFAVDMKPLHMLYVLKPMRVEMQGRSGFSLSLPDSWRDSKSVTTSTRDLLLKIGRATVRLRGNDRRVSFAVWFFYYSDSGLPLRGVPNSVLLQTNVTGLCATN